MVDSTQDAEGAAAGRRHVLKGLGTLGVAGGLLATAGSKPALAANAPTGRAAPVGATQGAALPTVTANQVIVSGANGGLFVYSGRLRPRR